MLDLVRKSLAGQLEAALSNLRNPIALCPSDQWEAKIGDFPFWHVAYHGLFYIDFYLAPNAAAFTPPSFHRTDYEHFGINVEDQPCTADMPYEKETLLEYAEHCRGRIGESIFAETADTLAGECGFWWYDIPRLEFHQVNIRHVQHHASQLSLHLRRAVGIEFDWIGSGWKPAE